MNYVNHGQLPGAQDAPAEVLAHVELRVAQQPELAGALRRRLRVIC